MFPLRTQQVNAIYRLVTMVYQYNYHNSGHYTSSCLFLKDDVSESGFCILLQVGPTQLCPVHRFCVCLQTDMRLVLIGSQSGAEEEVWTQIKKGVGS
jgi:hypothetical protein